MGPWQPGLQQLVYKKCIGLKGLIQKSQFVRVELHMLRRVIYKS